MAADESETPEGGAVETEPVPPGGAARVVRGRVAGLVKGGFEVEIEEGTAFCALAQMDLRRIPDASSFLHLELDFVLVGREPETGRWRLSRRRILEREARAREAELRQRIVPGAVLPGRVARLTDFGAFVDLGGVEGLVHLSEISHRRVARPSDELGVGQEVQVRVLEASVPRREGRRGGRRAGAAGSGRVSLSIKGAQSDPWDDVAAAFRPWQVADGRIVRVAEFGAFVELAPGVEGLLHESELPRGALERLEEASRGGALMAVLVLEVDPARRRIALGPAPRDLAAGERVEPVRLRVGAIVPGRVVEIHAGNVLVRLGPGQTGLIPPPETGTPRGGDLHGDFPVGAEIECEVLRVEGGGRRARLSRKRAVRRQERAEFERHAQSQSIGSLSTLGELLERARRPKEP